LLVFFLGFDWFTDVVVLVVFRCKANDSHCRCTWTNFARRSKTKSGLLLNLSGCVQFVSVSLSLALVDCVFVFAAQLGKKDWAKLALIRAKIMQNEVKEVEEGQAAGELQ
jgi:hypothetical protein